MVGGLVDLAIFNLIARIAPELVEIAKEVGYDLKKAKISEVLLLSTIDHHHQTQKILNEIYNLLRRNSEDLAVLLKRSEAWTER